MIYYLLWLASAIILALIIHTIAKRTLVKPDKDAQIEALLQERRELQDAVEHLVAQVRNYRYYDYEEMIPYFEGEIAQLEEAVAAELKRRGQ